MSLSKENRKKFVKKIIFWSVLTGGVIALFIPLLGAGSINVQAVTCSVANSDTGCRGRSDGQTCDAGGGVIGVCRADSRTECVCTTTTGNTGNSIFDPIDACDIGICLKGIEKAETGIGGTAELIFGIVNTFIFVSGAIAVGFVVYGGMQIAFNKTKEGMDTIRYALYGLALLLLVYVIVGVIYGIVDMIQTNTGTGSVGTSAGQTCQQQAEDHCQDMVSTGDSQRARLYDQCIRDFLDSCQD